MPVSAIVFAATTLVLLLGSAGFMVRALEVHDFMRGVFSVLLFGLALASGYETFALDERKPALWPTISRETAMAFIGYPGLWLACLVVVMLVAGALIKHFVSPSELFGPHTGWVVVGVAVVAVLIGAWIQAATRWTAL